MLELIVHRLQDMDERLVHDDDPILGIGRDIAQVLGAQTRVERVDDRSHERDGEVELDMLGLVPQHRRDTITVADAKLRQALGDAPGTLRCLAKRGAMDRAVRTTRDHRDGRGKPLGPLDQGRQRQLKVVHHQTVQHGFLAFLMSRRY